MCLGISFWAKTDVQDAAVADITLVLQCRAGIPRSGVVGVVNAADWVQHSASTP